MTAVGARVFARWTNGLYYRGFVTKSNRTTVFINYDDGDTITLKKLDRKAVVLDKLPKQWQLQLGKQVIGYWPGRVRYYSGVIASKSGCLHYVRFNDGDRRWAHLYEIRIIPRQ